MGDGTGCDNMTAVIAKLKPNAFREGKDKVICDQSMKKEEEKEEIKRKELQQNDENVSTEKRPLAADDVKEEQPEAKRAKTEATESPAVEEAATDGVEAADESTSKDEEDERKEKA